MFVLKYRDEDGNQEIKFKSKSELDDFISYNEDRASTSIDEKFEVISITGSEEPDVKIKMLISVMVDYSVLTFNVSMKVPFTSDYKTMSKIANATVSNLKSEGKIKGNPKVKLIGWSEVKEYKV